MGRLVTTRNIEEMIEKRNSSIVSFSSIITREAERMLNKITERNTKEIARVLSESSGGVFDSDLISKSSRSLIDILGTPVISVYRWCDEDGIFKGKDNSDIIVVFDFYLDRLRPENKMSIVVRLQDNGGTFKVSLLSRDKDGNEFPASKIMHKEEDIFMVNHSISRFEAVFDAFLYIKDNIRLSKVNVKFVELDKDFEIMSFGGKR